MFPNCRYVVNERFIIISIEPLHENVEQLLSHLQEQDVTVCYVRRYLRAKKNQCGIYWNGDVFEFVHIYSLCINVRAPVPRTSVTEYYTACERF